MNGSSNVLVLGVTGQVGKRVATNLKRRKANFSVGSRRKANLGELADHGRQASAATPSASPGPGQGRSIAFQLRPASPDLKRPRLLALYSPNTQAAEYC